MPRLAAAERKAIGLDPRPGANTHVIDDLSDRARLRDLIARETITHIIHAGGISGPMVISDDPAGIIAINVTGSMNLLYEAMAGGVKTFVYCSSLAAVGNFDEKEPIGEDYPLRPGSTYGCSKAAMDYVLRGLWKKVPLDICSLRLTAVYGPGRETEFNVDTIVRAALARKPAKIDPLTDWPYVYVDDAADAAIAACFATTRKQLSYYIVHPERVTPDDIAAACGAAGRPVTLGCRHVESARIAWRCGLRGGRARLRLSRAGRPPRGHSPHDRGCVLICHNPCCCGVGAPP